MIWYDLKISFEIKDNDVQKAYFDQKIRRTEIIY